MNRVLLGNLHGNLISRTNFASRLWSTPFTQPLNRTLTKAAGTNVHKPFTYKLATALKQFHRSHSSKAPINLNTAAIAKDLIVYKYENPRFYRIVNLFGFVQLFVLSYVSESLLHGLKNVPVDVEDQRLKNIPSYLRVNFGENSWRYGLATGIFLTGKRN